MPIDINDAENIVRGICSPYHVKKNGTLKPQAFDPTPKTDEVSVMRSDWLGANACKQQMKKLENKDKTYKGLAVLSAKCVRDHNADVKDSREVYYGHADIKHGFIIEAGEPLSAEIIHQLRERNKKLADAANYHPDKEPMHDIWNGPNLKFQISC